VKRPELYIDSCVRILTVRKLVRGKLYSWDLSEIWAGEAEPREFATKKQQIWNVIMSFFGIDDMSTGQPILVEGGSHSCPLCSIDLVTFGKFTCSALKAGLPTNNTQPLTIQSIPRFEE
jgi:hypothetical protein